MRGQLPYYALAALVGYTAVMLTLVPIGAQQANQAGPEPLVVGAAGYVACKTNKAWRELEAIKPNGTAWLVQIELKEKTRDCIRTLAGDVVYAGPPNVYLPEAVAVIFVGRPDAPEQVAWFIHHDAVPEVNPAFWTEKAPPDTLQAKQ